uniref:Uncharacterized protein n=2 Tax=Caenorhabditis japonica TaxID=281687 RepID=A0A8R1HTR1_CAEJA
MREAGLSDVALQKLEENSTHIVDKVAYMETRGKLLMDLEQPKQAEHVWRALLDRNPECLEYYSMLLTCMAINDSPKAQLAMLDELAEKHKKAAAPRRLALYLVEGEELRRRLHEWMIPMLRKGAPSLFASLVPLYAYPKKIAVIESVITGYINKMDDEGYENVSLGGSAEIEPPTTALWLYVLAAQHFDRIHAVQLALHYIERAIQHTPTVVENLMLKARIYKPVLFRAVLFRSSSIPCEFNTVVPPNSPNNFKNNETFTIIYLQIQYAEPCEVLLHTGLVICTHGRFRFRTTYTAYQLDESQRSPLLE